jgi:hypothetical protein
MHPVLEQAISIAEKSMMEDADKGVSASDMYQNALDAVYDHCMDIGGLSVEDALAIARSAASDGREDPPKGYKDLIAPFVNGHSVPSPEQEKRWPS